MSFRQFWGCFRARRARENDGFGFWAPYLVLGDLVRAHRAREMWFWVLGPLSKTWNAPDPFWAIEQIRNYHMFSLEYDISDIYFGSTWEVTIVHTVQPLQAATARCEHL